MNSDRDNPTLDGVNAEILAACIIATKSGGVNFAAGRDAWALYEIMVEDRTRHAGQALASNLMDARNKPVLKHLEKCLATARRYRDELKPLREMVHNELGVSNDEETAELIVINHALGAPYTWVELIAIASDRSIEEARADGLPYSLHAHTFIDQHPEVIVRISAENTRATATADAKAH